MPQVPRVGDDAEAEVKDNERGAGEDLSQTPSLERIPNAPVTPSVPSPNLSYDLLAPPKKED